MNAVLASILERCKTPDPHIQCWVWAGYSARGRYPMVRVDGEQFLVRRLALSQVKPPPTKTARAEDTCGEPLCCNPAHLYWLRLERWNREREWTRAQRLVHGQKIRKGMKKPESRLSREEVAQIRALAPYTIAEREEVAKRFGRNRRAIDAVMTYKTHRDTPFGGLA